MDLGTLGGRETVAAAVNGQGQVVGWSRTRSGSWHAFLWQRGVIQDLGTLGGRSSKALAINSTGVVAGFATTRRGAYHACLWQKGKVTDLGAQLGRRNSMAAGINDSGQVLGSLGLASGDLEKARWSGQPVLWQGRAWRRLQDIIRPNRGWQIDRAIHINNNGEIAGEMSRPGHVSARAFLWSHSKLEELSSLLGPNNGVACLNDGEKVALNVGSAKKTAIYLWHRGTVRRITSPAVAASDADGINNRGEIAGTSYWSGRGLAFVWAGKRINLAAPVVPPHRSRLTEAEAINDAGQIACNSASGRAYLLTRVH